MLVPASSLLLLATPIFTSKERSVMKPPADIRASPQDATTRVQLTTRRKCKKCDTIGDRFKVKPITLGAMSIVILLLSPTFNRAHFYNHKSTSNDQALALLH